jgi:hypothetical protein
MQKNGKEYFWFKIMNKFSSILKKKSFPIKMNTLEMYSQCNKSIIITSKNFKCLHANNCFYYWQLGGNKPCKSDHSFGNNCDPKVAFTSSKCSWFPWQPSICFPLLSQAFQIKFTYVSVPRLSLCLHKPYGSLTKLIIPITLGKYLNGLSVM